MSTVSQQQLSAENLVRFIEALQKINTTAVDAETNAVSIDDNNGERIIM